MRSPFDFFTKSVEAFQDGQKQLIKNLTDLTSPPVRVEEFTLREDAQGLSIYVEGAWRTMDEFIAMYTALRNQ